MSATKLNDAERAIVMRWLSLWLLAVQRQHERATALAPEGGWREPDAILFTSALRNLHVAAEMARPLNPGKVGTAIKRFEEAVPGFEHVRNIFEHFDAYARGEGHLQVDGAMAHDELLHVVAYDGTTTVIEVIGGPSLDVGAAADAAGNLAAVVLGLIIKADEDAHAERIKRRKAR